jgi:hypothetical protein
VHKASEKYKAFYNTTKECHLIPIPSTVKPVLNEHFIKRNFALNGNRVEPVLNGISRIQNIFLLKPGFCLIKDTVIVAGPENISV